MREPVVLAGRNVLVMGLGRRGGGVGSALYAAQEGATVRVTDAGQPARYLGSLAALADHAITYTLGHHAPEDFRWADVVIRNPDVPADSPFLAEARRHGAAVEVELSLFIKACAGRLIGVTGTKGKTTTCTLIDHVLRSSGRESVLVGNMGGSALAELGSIAADTSVVVELSSFHVEGLSEHGLSTDVAVLTGFGEDHLDRYPDLSAYAAAKAPLFANLAEDGWHVVPPARSLPPELSGPWPGARAVFGADEADARIAVWLEGDAVWLRTPDGREPLVTRADVPVAGDHRLPNVLAAVATAAIEGVARDAIQSALRRVPAVPHRFEPVLECDGVTWINDTTATNPLAASAAIRSLNGSQVVVIAGGYDKQLDLTELADALAAAASTVVLLEGTATDILMGLLRARRVAWVGPVPSMADAVAAARKASRSGYVLMSPGCASFGMFIDEFDRGSQFIAEAWKSAGRSVTAEDIAGWAAPRRAPVAI